jgi:tRNA G18 (ribose-2'-O)-methylase SpoU
VEIIDDPTDPRLDDYRHLTDRSARAAVEASSAPQGIFVVEGALALEQLLRSEHRVRSVLLTSARAKSLGGLVDDLAPDRVEQVLVAPREVLAEVTGYDVHRGVLAAALRPAPLDPATLLEGARRVLVVEGVTDNENVGALFRNAAAFGTDAVLLDGACTDPLYRRSIRVSSGWTLRLPHARVPDVGSALELCRAAGLRSVALSPRPDVLAVDVAAARGLLDDPVAVVVGAEGAGLGEEALEGVDVVVRIPMAGEVDSLNVATAYAVVAAMSAARRRWT